MASRKNLFNFSHTVLKCRYTLIFVLLIKDIYLKSCNFSWLFAVDSSHIHRCLGQTCTFEYVTKKPFTTTSYSSYTFLEVWRFIALFYPTIYFCCFRLEMKHTINSFKKRLEKQKNITFNYLDKICTEISSITTNCNEALCDILILLFTIQLINVFYHTYSILVYKSMA